MPFLPYFSVAYRFVSSVGQNVCRINLLQELKSQKKKPNRNTYWINTQRRQKVMRGVWLPCKYDEGVCPPIPKWAGSFLSGSPLCQSNCQLRVWGIGLLIRNQEFETSTCPIFVEICRYRQLLLTWNNYQILSKYALVLVPLYRRGIFNLAIIKYHVAETL